jgi:TonB family protein
MEFGAVDVPVQILPADGEADARDAGVLDPAAVLFKPVHNAAPPVTAMRSLHGTRDMKQPVAPPKSDWLEVVGVDAGPSVAMTVGYWSRPSGEGGGSDGVEEGEAVDGGGSEAGGGGSGHGRAAYLRNPRPVYPRVALENGWQGTTLLRVQVLADGTCGEMEILKSSGHEILDEAALKAVRRWRFVAARQKNMPVASWVEIPIHFELGHTVAGGGRGVPQT